MADQSSIVPDSFPGEISGIGRRVVALLVDWFASMGVVLLLAGAGSLGSSGGSLLILGVFVAEVVLFTWLIGSSFGQRLMGLRVVRVDGGRLGLWRIIVRTLLICLVLPPLVMDSYGRGLHDRAVGSAVVLRQG
jgi:uncharacterized RDD family membrane protein YckC